MKIRKNFRLIYLPPSLISSPKSGFSPDENYKILLLSESIKQNGLMFPISVRKDKNRYEVISGVKRLKAAVLSDMDKIPCIVCPVSERDAGMMAASELYSGRTADETEKEKCLEKLRTLGFSEDGIAVALCTSSFNLAPQEKKDDKKSEEKKEEILPAKEYPLKKPTIRFSGINDRRIFINSIRKTVDTMKECGMSPKFSMNENEKYTDIKIRISKTDNGQLKIPALDCVSSE